MWTVKKEGGLSVVSTLKKCRVSYIFQIYFFTFQASDRNVIVAVRERMYLFGDNDGQDLPMAGLMDIHMLQSGKLYNSLHFFKLKNVFTQCLTSL